MPVTSAQRFFEERRLNEHVEYGSVEAVWEAFSDLGALDRFRLTDGSLLFRGHRDWSWGLTSTLYRLTLSVLEQSQGDPQKKKARAEVGLLRTEDAVLRVARESGLGRNMGDLQLLGLLQHHGTPTRLVDVSRDPLVGLYFATEGADERPGRVFVLTVADEELPATPGHDLPWQPWISKGNVKRDVWSQKVWHVDGAAQDARMVAQSGTFLVGGLYSPGGDFPQRWHDTNRMIPVTEAREICTLAINFPRRELSPRRTSKWSAYGWTLTIEPHWKPTLRGLLKEAGVTADSIYPPVEEVRRLLSYWAEKTADAET